MKKIINSAIIAGLIFYIASAALFAQAKPSPQIKLNPKVEGSALKQENKTYKVGDIGPAGGRVFYDKGNYLNNWRYLEAAPADASIGIQWHNGKDRPITSDYVVSMRVGSGYANTKDIIAVHGEGKYAARVCRDLVIKTVPGPKGPITNPVGIRDWFLPSKDELDLMYKNVKAKGLGNFAARYYWSSTRYNDSETWCYDFDKGVQDHGKASVTYRVRAIRAF